MVAAKGKAAGPRSRDKKLKVKKETIRDLGVTGRAHAVKGGTIKSVVGADCTNPTGIRILQK